MNPAQAFLCDQIPHAKRAIIPTALKNAYDAVDLLVQSEPMLNIQSAKDNKGRIIQWAVDYVFQKLVESGQFGSDYRWRHFEKPTGKYLEIQFSHAALTISQVADPDKQPRDVGFRRNKRLSSQITMKEIVGDVEETAGIPHILLLHGHQKLNFAHLAIPDPLHRFGFQHRSRNLMLMAHTVPEPEVPTENTDIDAVMTIKEEIDRWRRDNESA